MTSKFNGFEHDKFDEGSTRKTEPPADYFELISAYIDGELSPAEKNQVQYWLDQDPKIKRTYTQLLALQGNMQRSIAPPSNKSVEEITTGVFQTIDQHRYQRKLIWGSGAIAASLLAVASLIPGLNPLKLNLASRQTPTRRAEPSSVMLAVAVNKPAINIPKALNNHEFK